MKYSIAVLNTDHVNRQNIRVPVSALAAGIADHVKTCASRKMPLGTPSHISHDMHRFIGWCTTTDIHINGYLSRQIGSIITPDTEGERAHFDHFRNEYWNHYHAEYVAPFKADLIQRVGTIDISSASFIFIEAAAIAMEGVASSLYPELFSIDGNFVDKDGLVDYRHLMSRTKEVQPGVFHEPSHDLILFAHRFFRRSLSRANSLNTYFLEEFSRYAEGSIATARLRLDPDVVGHPDSLAHRLELEYWRGPHFQNNIEDIPNGVSEHKADDRLRYFEGVDKTQFWWKRPETRSGAGQAQIFRTFEVEELIENYSGGLEDESYGCRYSHAEYDVTATTISHFDGAIRAYEGNDYLLRIDTSIDRAGKHSIYTKLFRLDGDIQISEWKNLLSNFFRGNTLIQEYLGGTAGAADDQPKTDGRTQIEFPPTARSPDLAALIRIMPSVQQLSDLGLVADRSCEVGDELIPYVEIGSGQVAECLRRHIDITINSVAFSDRILNLSPLVFGRTETIAADWNSLLSELGAAIAADADGNLIEHVSLQIIWEFDGLLIKVSLAGKASLVAQVVSGAERLIQPNAPVSDWIEKLSQALKTWNGPDTEPCDWASEYTVDGRLEYSRRGEVEFALSLPEELLMRLKL